MRSGEIPINIYDAPRPDTTNPSTFCGGAGPTSAVPPAYVEPTSAVPANLNPMALQFPTSIPTLPDVTLGVPNQGLV